MDIKKMAKQVRDAAVKNGPKLLTGASIGGTLVTVVLTVQATRKATTKLDQLRAEKQEEPTKKEIIKATWKYYIPVAAGFAITTACSICSNIENERRQAAAMALYSGSKMAFEEYKSLSRKELGDEKADKIEREAAINTTKRQPVDNVITLTEGSYLYRDNFTGLHFRSTENKIQADFYEFNKKFRNNSTPSGSKDGKCSLPLSELYESLGWSPVDIPPVVNDYVISFNPLFEDLTPLFAYDAAPNGEPCGVLMFSEPPVQEIW